MKTYLTAKLYLYLVVGMKISLTQARTVRNLFQVDRPLLLKSRTARSRGVSLPPMRGRGEGEMRIHRLSPRHLVIYLKDIYKLHIRLVNIVEYFR